MGNEYHEATDGLVKLFRKADHDLDIVHHRLQTEFQQLYPDNVSRKNPHHIFHTFFFLLLKTEIDFLQANPMKLVSRIKKIQEEISILKGQCHELLAAKQVIYYYDSISMYFSVLFLYNWI
jgi:hypothetical protein